jgi:polyphosphate glucokinase
MEILGVDIGGSAIKGAPVDTETGNLLAPRFRIATPVSPKPKEMAQMVAQVAENFGWDGPIGCGFPSVIRGGVVYTAANIHKKWEGTNAQQLFSAATDCPVLVLNDADAAGIAEMAFGAGRGQTGAVMIITIGTGLGVALFTNGQLFPNVELGHIQMDGKDAEWRASDAARKRDKLSWKAWAKRFDAYLNYLEMLFWPDLFILGGGVSKEADKFIPLLTVQASIVPAKLLNEAGIIGAALAARSLMRQDMKNR